MAEMVTLILLGAILLGGPLTGAALGGLYSVSAGRSRGRH